MADIHTNEKGNMSILGGLTHNSQLDPKESSL